MLCFLMPHHLFAVHSDAQIQESVGLLQWTRPERLGRQHLPPLFLRNLSAGFPSLCFHRQADCLSLPWVCILMPGRVLMHSVFSVLLHQPVCSQPPTSGQQLPGQRLDCRQLHPPQTFDRLWHHSVALLQGKHVADTVCRQCREAR